MIVKIILATSLLLLLLFSDRNSSRKKDFVDQFFIYNSRNGDTAVTDLAKTHDTTDLKTLMVLNLSGEKFQGRVSKLVNRAAPIDGEVVYYFTPDLGIIYRTNTTWSSYQRLHSTNDSIEQRISNYIDQILSRQELLKSDGVRKVSR